MYIVAIGWAYVILMMVLTAGSPGKALAILVFLGLLPLALFIYAFGRRKPASMALSKQVADQRDRADPQSDQRDLL